MMDKSLWVAAIGAIGLILASLASRQRNLKSERSAITQNLDIYSKLPKNSSARRRFLERIDQDITDFLIENRKIRRDLRGGIKSLVIILLLSGMGGFVIYGTWVVPEKTKISTFDQLFLTFMLLGIALAVLYFGLLAGSEFEKKLRNTDGSSSDGSDNL